MQLELNRATVEILNDGTYEGMKHLTFPIRIENCVDYGADIGLVDVPLDALIAAGYDKVKGRINEDEPDCYDSDKFLPFSYGECRIVK